MINVNVPVNSLSFGHCSVSILRELYKKNEEANLFFIGEPDFSAYQTETDFQFWINSAGTRALKSYKRTDPCFKLWHISNSESSVSNEQSLLTFHEVDSLTPVETNILKNQKTVLVSSKFSENVFKAYGVNNVVYCPLGFDAQHFKQISRTRNTEQITFSLFGKFEKRKHTEKVIRAWLKQYGNNNRYTLNLHVYNSFFSQEQNNQLLLKIFGGRKPWNVNCLGYVPTLAEFNSAINAADIVIDMSGGEGFSLPSFHSVALGKHAVVHNCSSIKDWAEDAGAVLVEPSGKEPVYDGVFFRQGDVRNQGNIFTWDEDDFLSACKVAEANFAKNPVNEKGLELQNKFTWGKTVDVILENTK